jgi:hypothetical protein
VDTLPAGSSPAIETCVFQDDFVAGLRTHGVGAGWRLRPSGALVRGDGRVSGTANGVLIRSSGRHPRTGEPAFTWTAGPGENDHLKWAAFTDRQASSGVPGFDVPAGGVLTCVADLSVRTFGTAGHPFQADADATGLDFRTGLDPEADPRLATGALIAADLETGLVCDFLFTNTRIHALYERIQLPGRPKTAFSYAVPVAVRTPDRRHHCEISYDDGAGTLRWLIDGAQVLEVRKIGRRCLPAEHLVIDAGGPDSTLRPRQLTYGLGLLTLLDAADADGVGLARLEPDSDMLLPGEFRDELGGSRLWGQGVQLAADRLEVWAKQVWEKRSDHASVFRAGGML